MFFDALIDWTGEYIGRGHGVTLGPRAKTKGQIFPVRPVRYLLCVRHYSLGFETLFTGDLEVDRLLNEIDDAVKLLPYLIEKDKTTSASQDIEQAVRPYKVENAQLRRFVYFLHLLECLYNCPRESHLSAILPKFQSCLGFLV